MALVLAVLLIAAGSTQMVGGVGGIYHDDGVYISTARALACNRRAGIGEDDRFVIFELQSDREPAEMPQPFEKDGLDAYALSGISHV
jgi:hypothetical protein